MTQELQFTFKTMSYYKPSLLLKGKREDIHQALLCPLPQGSRDRSVAITTELGHEGNSTLVLKFMLPPSDTQSLLFQDPLDFLVERLFPLLDPYPQNNRDTDSVQNDNQGST